MRSLGRFLIWLQLTGVGIDDGVVFAGETHKWTYSKKESGTLKSNPSIQVNNSHLLPCTPEEILFTGDEPISSGWTAEMVDTMPYDCSCGMMRARYICLNWGNRTYPMWEPVAASAGRCTVMSRSEVIKEPFPRGWKILAYGNSHMRQAIEGLMCMCRHALESRRVRHQGILSAMQISPDVPCRTCYGFQRGDIQILEKHSCIDPATAAAGCSCDDSVSVFNFANTATLHYFFAHKEDYKSIEDALQAHGTTFGDYDVVFGNTGNQPIMEAESMLQSAHEMQQAGVPFFWLSTYTGYGDIDTYLDTVEKRAAFEASGARYIPVHEMMDPMKIYNKGEVEHVDDTHMCMPGPSNEISVLLSRLVWSESLRSSGDRDR